MPILREGPHHHGITGTRPPIALQHAAYFSATLFARGFALTPRPTILPRLRKCAGSAQTDRRERQ